MIATRSVRIVGAATGRGAADPGCALGPNALRRSGLVKRLREADVDVRWDATLSAEREVDALTAVREFSARLSRYVHGIASKGMFPLVLGGDHSCAIGTWSGVASAVRRRGQLGLLWIDAHMDAHVPSTSPTGNLHGMPLACVLGYGDPTLAAISGHPAVAPEHVCIVGVRSYEDGEAQLLNRLGVRVIGMDEVDRRGLGAVMDEALAVVTTKTAAFGVTLDLDAVDPAEAPGVGTPVAAGLRTAALLPAMAELGADPRLAALEIVEYNPLHDRGLRTARLTAALAIAALGVGSTSESDTETAALAR